MPTTDERTRQIDIHNGCYCYVGHLCSAHKAIFTLCEAIRAETLEEAAKIATDYAAVYMSENTHGDGRKCGEQIAAAIRSTALRAGA